MSIVFDFADIAKRMKDFEPKPSPAQVEQPKVCGACLGDGWECLGFGYGEYYEVCRICKNPLNKPHP
jgi:hypothetical protein